MTLIAVCGKGRNCPRSLSDLAFDVGWVLGHTEGVVVVTGGLGGVMAAAAHGAFGCGATTISLIPEGREDDAHGHTDLALRTGLTIPFRNALLGSMVDGAIICPGSHGTVQEAMVIVERGVPVVATGDHRGYLSDALELPHHEDPAAAVGLLAHLLALAAPVP